MRKVLFASLIVLLIALAVLPTLPFLVTANFLPVTNGVVILSPDIAANPALHYNYQNSTVNLTISVSYVKEGLIEPPKVSFISYSLDGQPLVYLRNLSVSNWFYSQYNQNITNYGATTTLENLPEGNHTINAYANDMSTTRTFTVDSHYVVPIIKILSPTNQTYSGNVPLEFIVNTNFTDASYLMWPKTMDTHFEGQLGGNSTLKNLSSGNYVIEVSAITDKGDHIMGTAHFSVNSNYPANSALSPNPNTITPTLSTTVITIILIFILFAIALVSLVYFKRRKRKP